MLEDLAPLAAAADRAHARGDERAARRLRLEVLEAVLDTWTHLETRQPAGAAHLDGLIETLIDPRSWPIEPHLVGGLR